MSKDDWSGAVAIGEFYRAKALKAQADRERAAAPGHIHAYDLSPHCGARVCADCNEHAGLDRCPRCGWLR